MILTGSDSANYTLAQPAGITANITVGSALTVTGAVAENKVYDGTTAATVIYSSASLTGVLGSDAVTLDTTSKSASFATKDVGPGKPVTVTGLTLGGGDASNYTLAQPAGLTASITSGTALTVSGMVSENKVYDGTTTASVYFSGASLVGNRRRRCGDA